MSNEHRRQKKLEKHRRKRQAKARAVRHRPSAEIERIAAKAPIEGAYISRGWQDVAGPMPSLVTVVLTRRLPSGQLLPLMALVDRTCLGLKNGIISPPIADWQLPALLQRIGGPYGGMEPCEPLVAQSVIFHAVDYARSLGFSPHPDLPLSLLGPRPEQLVDTPLCRPEQPIYVSGPDDNVPRILATLDRAVGRGNYRMLAAAAQLGPMFGPLAEEEDEDDVDDEDRPEGADPGMIRG